jgi:hypothetical protein
MGYPSTGCETMYRNSLTDAVAFFQKYHKSNVKVIIKLDLFIFLNEFIIKGL